MGLPRAIVPGRIYMVTRRCSERRFLLRPDEAMTEAFTYCLSEAAERTGVLVLFSAVMSNHHHTGVIDVEGRLPEFLEYLHKFVAKCGNALRGRWESFWSSEQTSCVQLVEPNDILDKLVYAVTNPVKDHLVEKVSHWPGLDCLRAIAHDKPIVARRPRWFFREDGCMPETSTLSFVRPPGFEQLSQAEWVALLLERIKTVEHDCAAERARTGRRVLGRKAILRQHWNSSPASLEPRRNLSPRVAAKSKWARVEALQRNAVFLEAYRSARAAFLRGEDVIFPPGTYWLRRFARVKCAPWAPPE